MRQWEYRTVTVLRDGRSRGVGSVGDCLSFCVFFGQVETGRWGWTLAIGGRAVGVVILLSKIGIASEKTGSSDCALPAASIDTRYRATEREISPKQLRRRLIAIGRGFAASRAVGSAVYSSAPIPGNPELLFWYG